MQLLYDVRCNRLAEVVHMGNVTVVSKIVYEDGTACQV